MAIRVGDYKLIVGMFARCGRDPNRAGADEDFITQRMCGWWLPMGEEGNAQRTAEIAEANALNENASRYGGALASQDQEAIRTDTSAPSPVPPALPVLLFNIALDPNGTILPRTAIQTLAALLIGTNRICWAVFAGLRQSDKICQPLSQL